MQIISDTNHHTAPVSPRLWCRSEPEGCWRYGTGPGCASWESRPWDARPLPREIPASRTEQSWASALFLPREPSACPPATTRVTEFFYELSHDKLMGRPDKAAHLLDAHPLGHRDDAAVAFNCCYQGQSNTCKKQLVMFLLFSKCHPGEMCASPPRRVPVLPEVGSMMVSPGFSTPALSASSTIRRAMRSFTLPPALRNSHLATKNSHTNQSYFTGSVLAWVIY